MGKTFNAVGRSELSPDVDAVMSEIQIRKIVSELNDDGLTVFITTHNMIEAGDICSRVAIINKGRIAAIDTPGNLRSMVRKHHYVEAVFREQAPPLKKLEAIPDVIGVECNKEVFKLYTETPGSVATLLVILTLDLGLELEQLNTRKPSLEDVFLYYTGDGGSEWASIHAGTDGTDSCTARW